MPQLIEQKRIGTKFNEKTHYFNVAHYYLKDDPWKSYYLVSLDSLASNYPTNEIPLFLRLDSGCTSGQIYNDQSCDCLEQLQQGLLGLIESKNEKSILIHIPTHDGRGFGTAPKAETEIYKRGGNGRVHKTEKLDTVKAATLLYNTDDFDIRTYEGCAKILTLKNIKRVDLLTDNKGKIEGLIKHGISVNRKKTFTAKQTCLEHIQAKKNSNYYFSD